MVKRKSPHASTAYGAPATRDEEGHDVSCPYEEKSTQPRVAVLREERRKSKSPWFGSAHHRLRRNGPYGTPVFQNETNPGVPSLLLEQGVKECPASLSPKAAARSG